MGLRYVEIRDHIAGRIQRGELVPGQQLESEIDLAVSFAVSRPTVRQALSMLEQERLITRHQGKGTFVCEPETPSPDRGHVAHFIASSLSQPFVGQLLAGAEAELARHGWALAVTSTGDSIERESEALEAAVAAGAAGILIHPTAGPYYNPTLVRLIAEGVPTVMLARHYQFVRCDFVEGDNYGGAKKAVEFLVERGHTRIAVITKPLDTKSSMADRLRGYRDGLGDAGLPYDRTLVFDSLQDPRSGYGLAERADIREQVVRQIAGFLRCKADITAALVFNDLVAGDTAIAARRVGRTPPEDLAIVGFDDVDVPHHETLASVHVPLREIGMQGARLLVDRVLAPDADTAGLYVRTTISIRETGASGGKEGTGVSRAGAEV